MPWLKKYVYIPFFITLPAYTTWASTETHYPAENNQLFTSPQNKPTINWEPKESENVNPSYCLTPADPGCSNMWRKEKEDENNQRIHEYQQKKLYNAHK